MKDILTRGIAKGGHIQASACLTTGLVNEAVRRHDLWPVAAAALGRTMSAAAMMAVQLKDPGARLEVQIDGKGELGKITVGAKPDGSVRGYVAHPHVNFVRKETGGLAVGVAVGTNGYLKVIKDLGLKGPWSGSVELRTGEIGDDFAYYFSVSEQIPSAIGVGVLVAPDQHIISAGGWLVQMMPDATAAETAAAEELIKKMEPASRLLERGVAPIEMIRMIVPDYEELETVPLAFRCECSRERSLNILRLIKPEELKAIIDEDAQCDMHCEFCGNSYHFTKEELEAVYAARVRA